MSQIQQKLLENKAFPSKWSPIFFGKTGHVTIVLVEQRRTIYSEWYTNFCLPVVFQEIRKINRRRWITLYHDNASSHTSAQISAFFEHSKHRFDESSAYSPDFVPNNFFLLPYVKNKTRGQCFSTPEETIDAFRVRDTSIRVAKVLRQLVQMHAKVFRS